MTTSDSDLSNVPYLLGHDQAEADRLRLQAEDLATDTRWLLDQVGLRPGSRALDIGCGPQGILDLLSERVGPRGKAIGLEQSLPTVQRARRFAKVGGLENVEVVHGDANRTGLPRGSFDFVHARLVLINIPEPQRVVDEMAALARSGGIVASHEGDWHGWICDPPSAARDAMFEICDNYARDVGIDLAIGRKSHRLLRAAGLEDVRVHPTIRSLGHGHPRRGIFLEFLRNMRGRLLAHGAISEAEFNRLTGEMARDLDDPHRLLCHPYFLAWGRKPESSDR
jgi:SAM-dependent methyltransferase